jgi:copper transport protein
LTYLAVGVGIGGMLVTGGAQAALTGGSFSAIGHWSLDTQAFGGTLGRQSGAQLVGLAACLASFHLRTSMQRQFAAFYGLLIAAGAFVLFGHATVSQERWLSIPADVVHVVLVAMWAGGLVGLVLVLRRRVRAARRAGDLATTAGDQGQQTTVRTSDAPHSAVGRTATSTALLERAAPPSVTGGSGLGASDSDAHHPERGALLADTAGVVARFSTMAGVSFAGIVVAGTLLAVAEVGSVANLFETGYGQLLLLKLALVGLLLFLAWYNRYLLLPGLLSAGATTDRRTVALGWRRLLGTVRLEAVGVVAVLGITAVLANGTPSNGASAPPPVPFTQTQAFDGGRVTLHITPNQALVNDWTVQFRGRDGQPEDMAESVSLYLVLPSQNVGPIETDMKKSGVGRFVLVNSPNPPVVGKWQVVLQVQVSEFSQPDVSFGDTVQ